ncbi:Abortive infection bacteriophage resistance protein (AbiF) [Fructobacillus evanidus]|uniref:Abortive infection bacteriophage resistance protein (AbiF) n=1 Tax=Fructobacillus evanidus TaxID=3064281 RepID=A0ABM9N1Y3_9LACO|nr:Abortive infection bacteriophage resistance protein (AbiF) [Fructobacillus sp. LMG 32999]CAK1243785.1 Abortive infection bacteriophage resistance protein (AbiF) [Fructobacillus sp. LMG 32999]CAK1254260.1 Abortive infection bacteriophage resistance protein (AbiF) [Fructobacillus sp. LMG 32999]CAK1254747.1 Abortive infection bacteriophage resistance protein (AbiF) [Fructobacillus sp. LMG 32999]
MSKKYQDIDQKIQILKQRNLLFTDEEDAKYRINEFGYYEIISDNSDPFMIDEKYIEGTRFFDIYALFCFGGEIRDHIQKSSIFFEKLLRQAVLKAWCEEYGNHQSKYLDKKNFRFPRTGPQPLNNLVSKFAKVSFADDDPILNKARVENNNVAPWILVKFLDFGNIISWYELLKPELKTKVMKHLLDDKTFNNLNSKSGKDLFTHMLKLIKKFRNRSAHGGQVYTYMPTLPNGKPFIKYNQYFHSKFGITKEKYDEGYGQTGIWTILALLKLIKYPEPYLILSHLLNGGFKEYLQKVDTMRHYINTKTFYIDTEIQNEQTHLNI